MMHKHTLEGNEGTYNIIREMRAMEINSEYDKRRIMQEMRAMELSSLESVVEHPGCCNCQIF